MALAADQLKLTLQLCADGDRLEVRATADRGEGYGETSLPSPRLLELLGKYTPGDFPQPAVKAVGQGLAKSLLPGDVGRLAFDLLQDGIAARQAVQFELRFDPDQVALAQFPWEMIANDLGQFLVRDGLVDLTRYITYPQPPPVFDAALRDRRLLRVVAQPRTLEALSFGDLGVVGLETLPHASFERLSYRLLVEQLALWGLQFDGHAALLLACDRCDALSLPRARFCGACGNPLRNARRVAALAFERDGAVDWVAADKFGAILYNARVRLALLLACETARIGGDLVWSGLAPNLLLAGVPAVLGMQYPVYDEFANAFAKAFYAALLRTNDVVAATRIARRLNLGEAWYSPVLYLRHQKPAPPAGPATVAYETRAIDTAVPAAVRAGDDFLVRLWIRRPETKPAAEAQLRMDLDVPAGIAVATGTAGAEVAFAPVAGRMLRRGEVEINLSGTRCEVRQPHKKLFVDEQLDAPPAIFVVRATAPGHATLLFEVAQDGGAIASIVHHVEVKPGGAAITAVLATASHALDVGHPAAAAAEIGIPFQQAPPASSSPAAPPAPRPDTPPARPDVRSRTAPPPAPAPATSPRPMPEARSRTAPLPPPLAPATPPPPARSARSIAGGRWLAPLGAAALVLACMFAATSGLLNRPSDTVAVQVTASIQRMTALAIAEGLTPIPAVTPSPAVVVVPPATRPVRSTPLPLATPTLVNQAIALPTALATAPLLATTTPTPTGEPPGLATPIPAGKLFTAAPPTGKPLTLFAGPSLADQPIGDVPAGTTMRFVEGPIEDGRRTWVRVQADQLLGWALLDQLRPAETPTMTPSPTVDTPP